MKNDIYDYLIFEIGSEFADYEFDLIAIAPYETIEQDLSLELYEYFGKINKVLNHKTKQVLLYFNADILVRVQLIFIGNITDSLKYELENINVELPSYLMIILRKYRNYTILMYQNKLLNQQTIK